MNTQSVTFLALILALVGIGHNPASAASIDINPIKDNTLYEYVPADGDLSNGIGNHFFAGKTGMGYIRRGVLAFDIAGSVPLGSTIISVSLTMHMSRTALSTARTIELHRLLADSDWGRMFISRTRSRVRSCFNSGSLNTWSTTARSRQRYAPCQISVSPR